MQSINSSSRASFGEQLLSELRDFQQTTKAKAQGNTDAKPKGPSFMEHLQQGIEGVNQDQKLSDKAATDLATGKKQNIHETMLAASQAEITFNLMVQVRNKALEAYQEIMRMPV